MGNCLRIAHLRDSNFVGGPERQIVEHILGLDSEKYAAVLCSLDRGTPSELHEVACQRGIQCRRFSSCSPFDTRVIRELVQFIKQERIDLFVAHSYKTNVVGRVACWLAGIPFMVVSRGWTGESRKIKLYEAVDKLFLFFANKIVAVSEGQKRKITGLGVRSGKVSVIHNCIQAETWSNESKDDSLREKLGIPKDAILVTTAGRLSPEKDHSTLIRAAKAVMRERDDVYFAVFGEGFLRPELQQAIDDSGLNGRFLLPGFFKDMAKVMLATDIFSLPSLSEGLPNVVLEAFACSKPVIATEVGGTPELVEDGKNGFLIQVGEHETLAEKIQLLAGDATLRETMGANGRELVQSEFVFQKQALKYDDVYSKLIGG